jgi:diguanylate cyclase (GGDEF)-like protein
MLRVGVRDPALGERPEAQDPWRSRIALATAILALVSAGSGWWIERLEGNPDSFERYGLPLIALAAAVTAALHRTRVGRDLQVGLLGIGAFLLLERLHNALAGDLPGAELYVEAYEVVCWLPLPYLFAYVLLPTRRALLFSLALLGAACAVMWSSVSGRPELVGRLDLLEMVFANVACVFFIHTLSSLKERWAAAESLATALRHLAETDHLTGLPNRREVTARIEREILRSVRYGGPLALLLFDLDGFKNVNDRFGHEAGDRALRRAAAIALGLLRSTDVCGRWGGEEFLIALPGVGLEGGRESAERMRRALETERAGEGEPRLTASFGVTAFVPGDTLESLVRRADAALYEAKRTGRNRVELVAPEARTLEEVA